MKQLKIPTIFFSRCHNGKDNNKIQQAKIFPLWLCHISDTYEYAKVGKKKTKIKDSFPCWFGQLVKRGMAVRGMCSACVLIFFKVVIEGSYVSPELTAVWNITDRLPEHSHYLLSDCNVSLWLLSLYCLHFAFVKRALIEPYKGRYFYLSMGSMKMCLQVQDIVYTPQ